MNKLMDRMMEKLEPFLYKITTEVHMLAVRDTLISVVPFLILGGFATLFSAILFADGSFLTAFMDAETMARWNSLFTRIYTGTMGLLSVFIVIMLPYYMANQRKFNNPIMLSATSLAIFFVFTPLAGGYDYFGTQGVLLSLLIGLLSSELYMRLSKVDALKWDLGGNVPEVVSRSFGDMFVAFITIVVFALAATAINVISNMETIEWIYSVLQAPLVHIGASLPGAILFHIINGFFFTLGIQPSGIAAPLEAAFIAATGEGYIIDQPFIYTFGQVGGSGSAWGLIFCLLLFTHRKDLKSVGKLTAFPVVFNITEPVLFGLPVVFNFVFMIPMIIVPIINTVLAYFATFAGLLPVMSNTIVWSMPIFVRGFIGSNGDIRACVAEAILLVLDVFLWLPFVKMYEKSLDAQEAKESEAVVPTSTASATQDAPQLASVSDVAPVQMASVPVEAQSSSEVAQDVAEAAPDLA